MTFEKFVEQVKEQIRAFMPEKYADALVDVQEVEKPNDRKLHALQIRCSAERISPSIYLEGYYRMHKQGDSMGKILSALADEYTKAIEQIDGLDIQDFNNFENIKDRLCVTVMNKHRHTEYLKEAICKDMQGTDLVSVVRIQADTGQGKMSLLVKEGMLKQWGLTAEKVYEMAFENTVRLFLPSLTPMEEMLYSLAFKEEATAMDRESLAELFGTDKERKDPMQEMFILTNLANYNGAVTLFYPGLLEKIGEALRSNLIILPSSVHETILVKEREGNSIEELQSIVMEINRQHVAPDEVLSDEVYRYDYKERKLVMATDPERTAEIAADMKDLTYNYDDWGRPLEEQEEEER